MQHLRYRMRVLHVLDTLSHEECRTRNLEKSPDPNVERKMLHRVFRKSGACLGKTRTVFILVKRMKNK